MILDFSKTSCHWIPKILLSEQKAYCSRNSKNHLSVLLGTTVSSFLQFQFSSLPIILAPFKEFLHGIKISSDDNKEEHCWQMAKKKFFVHFFFSIHNIILLLKKRKKMYIYILALEFIIITRMHISNPFGKTWPWR